MDDRFCYLNTDLDLTSVGDLTPLAAAFEAQGFWPLQVARADDGLWYASFELHDGHEEPEPTIAGMLGVIEKLSDEPRALWSNCQRREFNVGYDCGSEPWAFNQGLSSHLLGRIAAAGASLRITLYRPAQEKGPGEAKGDGTR